MESVAHTRRGGFSEWHHSGTLLVRAVNLIGKLKEENLIQSKFFILKTQEGTKVPISSINFTDQPG